MVTEPTVDDIIERFMSHINCLLGAFYKVRYGQSPRNSHNFQLVVVRVLILLIGSKKYNGNLRDPLPALLDQSVDLENASDERIQDFAYIVRKILPYMSDFQIFCLLDMILDFAEGDKTHLDPIIQSCYGVKVSTEKFCKAFGREYIDANRKWAMTILLDVFIFEPASAVARAGYEIADIPCMSMPISASVDPE